MAYDNQVEKWLKTLFTTFFHFFALYQQIKGLQGSEQEIFNEIKDLEHFLREISSAKNVLN